MGAACSVWCVARIASPPDARLFPCCWLQILQHLCVASVDVSKLLSETYVAQVKQLVAAKKAGHGKKQAGPEAPEAAETSVGQASTDPAIPLQRDMVAWSPGWWACCRF
jgi:hypothetical protein